MSESTTPPLIILLVCSPSDYRYQQCASVSGDAARADCAFEVASPFELRAMALTQIRLALTGLSRRPAARTGRSTRVPGTARGSTNRTRREFSNTDPVRPAWLISHRSFGFHSAAPLIALIYLGCGDIEIELPVK